MENIPEMNLEKQTMVALAGRHRWMIPVESAGRYLFLTLLALHLSFRFCIFFSLLLSLPWRSSSLLTCDLEDVHTQVWTLENYSAMMVLKPYPFTHYLLNSIYVAVAVTLAA